MKLSAVSNTTVMHCHSGVPRPYELRGAFFCLEVSKLEFAQFTEREVRLLTRSWSQAYEILEDGSGGRFYLKPRPRVRFLAAYERVSVDQFLQVVSLTNASVKQLRGKEAYDLLRFFFLEAAAELGNDPAWQFDDGASYQLDNQNTSEGGRLEICLPRQLLSLLEAHREYFQPAIKRLGMLTATTTLTPT